MAAGYGDLNKRNRNLTFRAGTEGKRQKINFTDIFVNRSWQENGFIFILFIFINMTKKQQLIAPIDYLFDYDLLIPYLKTLKIASF